MLLKMEAEWDSIELPGSDKSPLHNWGSLSKQRSDYFYQNGNDLWRADSTLLKFEPLEAPFPSKKFARVRRLTDDTLCAPIEELLHVWKYDDGGKILWTVAAPANSGPHASAFRLDDTHVLTFKILTHNGFAHQPNSKITVWQFHANTKQLRRLRSQLIWSVTRRIFCGEDAPNNDVWVCTHRPPKLLSWRWKLPYQAFQVCARLSLSSRCYVRFLVGFIGQDDFAFVVRMKFSEESPADFLVVFNLSTSCFREIMALQAQCPIVGFVQSHLWIWDINCNNAKSVFSVQLYNRHLKPTTAYRVARVQLLNDEPGAYSVLEIGNRVTLRVGRTLYVKSLDTTLFSLAATKLSSGCRSITNTLSCDIRRDATHCIGSLFPTN
jgi:hypothetical protein